MHMAHTHTHTHTHTHLIGSLFAAGGLELESSQLHFPAHLVARFVDLPENLVLVLLCDVFADGRLYICINIYIYI